MSSCNSALDALYWKSLRTSSGECAASCASKNLEEAPQSTGAENGDGNVIVPAEQVDGLANASHNTGHDTHGAESQVAGNDSLVLGPSEEVLNRGRQAKLTLERKREVSGIDGWVLGFHAGRDPAIERRSGDDTHHNGGQTACQALSLAYLGSVPAPPPAGSAGSRVAPAQQHHGHDANVLGEEAESRPSAQKIPDNAVPAVDLRFAHQGAQTSNVEAVERRITVPYDVSREDRDEEREQNGVDLGWLRIRGVEPESEEADGSVEDLARDFVSVNL